MTKRRPPVSKARALAAKLWGWRWQTLTALGLAAALQGHWYAHVYRSIAIEAVQTAEDSIEVGEIVKAAKAQCAEEHSDVTGLMLLYEGDKLKKVKGLCFNSTDERGLDTSK